MGLVSKLHKILNINNMMLHLHFDIKVNRIILFSYSKIKGARGFKILV